MIFFRPHQVSCGRHVQRSLFRGRDDGRDGYQRRLRAVVQNTLTDFEEIMREEGQARVIVDKAERMKLSGPPLIIGELFVEQCAPWTRHVTKAKEGVIEATYNAKNRCSQLDLDGKVSQLLDPVRSVHPCTCNHYLIDSVQNTVGKTPEELQTSFENYLDIDDLENNMQHSIRPSRLLDALDQSVETDMERYASESAVDYMQAYYKVALKSRHCDFSTLAVEQCLVRRLPYLFRPEMIHEMSDEDVSQLASETEDTTNQRESTHGINSVEHDARMPSNNIASEGTPEDSSTESTEQHSPAPEPVPEAIEESLTATEATSESGDFYFPTTTTKRRRENSLGDFDYASWALNLRSSDSSQLQKQKGKVPSTQPISPSESRMTDAVLFGGADRLDDDSLSNFRRCVDSFGSDDLLFRFLSLTIISSSSAGLVLEGSVLPS
ncbi:hypothetical protein Q7P37_007638 [Cladosporium fusiforme]